MSSSRSDAEETTQKFVTLCKRFGVEQLRIIRNEGCSEEKSFDFYFTPGSQHEFIAIRGAAFYVGARLGEYQNIEEGCVTLLGQEFIETAS